MGTDGGGGKIGTRKRREEEEHDRGREIDRGWRGRERMRKKDAERVHECVKKEQQKNLGGLDYI